MFWCNIKIMVKLCTNKNHSYKHNEQINKQNIDNSECFGSKYVKIYPEMTSQYFFEKIGDIYYLFSICCLRMK
jgi:hypothetical protein